MVIGGEKMLFFILLLNVVVQSNAAPVTSYMTACERKLHTQCVIKIGTSKEFEVKCQPGELLECLRFGLDDEVCKTHDKETLPTIRRLIGVIERKFKKDPDLCKSRNKFGHFLRRIQDEFIVQGEGIEFTDPRNPMNTENVSSGSGQSEIPDDTEMGEDDENDENKQINNEKENVLPNANQQTANKEKDNEVPKTSNFWKEKSKLILKGKNDRKVQLFVYFDDTKQKNKKKEEDQQNEVSNAVKTAWKELKERYQRWYEASKYNKVK